MTGWHTPDFQRVWDRINATGLQHRVRPVGHVPEALLPSLYGGAHVFCLPPTMRASDSGSRGNGVRRSGGRLAHVFPGRGVWRCSQIVGSGQYRFDRRGPQQGARRRRLPSRAAAARIRPGVQVHLAACCRAPPGLLQGSCRLSPRERFGVQLALVDPTNSPRISTSVADSRSRQAPTLAALFRAKLVSPPAGASVGLWVAEVFGEALKDLVVKRQLECGANPAQLWSVG